MLNFKVNIISLLLFFFWFNSAGASILTPLEASRVNVKIPYSLGTHELEARGFTGSVDFTENTQLIKSGSIVLEVIKLKGKKQTLVCHMYEALSLDYEKSDFPEDHVCEDDKLPLEGKNSPVHTEIKVQLLKPVSIESNSVMLMWTIHGVTREQEVPAKISWDKEARRLRIQSNFAIDLKDYNITVKKFLFIGVKDQVTLELELILGEK